jgi:hypothetical protein
MTKNRNLFILQNKYGLVNIKVVVKLKTSCEVINLFGVLFDAKISWSQQIGKLNPQGEHNQAHTKILLHQGAFTVTNR